MKKGKKISSKKPAKRGPRRLGKITHYFGKIDVGIVKLTSSLKIGDFIRIQTHAGDFVQPVESMQINHKNISAARPGAEIGLKVAQKVKEGDLVFLAEKPKPVPQTPASGVKPVEEKKEAASQPPMKKTTGYSDVKFLRF